MYPNTFYRVSVKALARDVSGSILVVKENQTTWSLPGGGLDHGEEPQSGLLRELKEELGIDQANIKGIVTVKTFYLEQKSAWLLWIVYDVTISDANFSYGEGVTHAQFIDPSTLSASEDIFERLVYDISAKM